MERVEERALAELHDHAQVGRLETRSNEGDDVRVRQRRHDVQLVQVLLLQRLGDARVEQRLERDRVVLVPALVHHAHAAAADLRAELDVARVVELGDDPVAALAVLLVLVEVVVSVLVVAVRRHVGLVECCWSA